MSRSVHPAAVTRPAPRPLPTLVKQMLMMVVAVGLPVVLMMLCVASPRYYDLKLAREKKLLGNGTSAQEQDLSGKMGLDYYWYWRMNHWVLGTPIFISFVIGVFLLTGHGIRNMEGGPSFRWRLIMSITHFLIINVNWALLYHFTDTAGRLDWDCYSPEMTALKFRWNLFSTFGLMGIVSFTIVYLSTKDLNDKQAAKNWRYVSILVLASSAYSYLMASYPKIVVIFLNAKSDTEKIFIRLVVIPAMNSIGFQLVHWASTKLKLHDPSDSVYVTMIFLLQSSFYSRFFQNSLSTYEGTVFLNTIVGLQEIVMRFSLKARGRVFAKYVLRRTDAELVALEGESVSGEEQAKRDYTARLIVMEVLVEYVALLLAPLLTILNQKNSVDVHLGYDMDGSYDGWLLLFSVVTSVIFELCVDTVCFKVQEKWFQLHRAWDRLTATGKLWRRMYPNVLIPAIVTVFLTLTGFVKPQQYFASDRCAFVANCLPDPCMCYSNSSSTVTVQSLLTGKNVSLALPPLFDTLCSELGEMSEYQFRIKYSKILTN